jgi:hypothetical protein
MAFNVKNFADQVRPSPKRPSPEPFDNSVFDAGSPQYVRPEDLFLDIQARLFGLKPFRAKDLAGIEPSNFRTRWLRDGAPNLQLQRIGHVSNDQLADAVMSLLRCPQRKNERHPTLLPVVPTLSYYKNIKANLPNFLNDQFRPALSFADEIEFAARTSSLKDKLRNGTPGDTLKELTMSLLRPATSLGSIPLNPDPLALHVGPLLKNYSVTPSRPLPVCDSLREAIDALISIESLLPRVLWTRWLTATLRLWLPLFFLKRCTVTAAAAHAAKSSLANSAVLPLPALTDSLLAGRPVLRGSNEWLNQLAPIVQNYVRGRFELSILLELSNLYQRLVNQGLDPLNTAHAAKVRQELDVYEVDSRRANNPSLPPASGMFSSVKLGMPGDSGAGRLPLNDWLAWVVANQSSLDAVARLLNTANTVDLIERVYGYIRPDYEPLKSGFGKNALEYVAFALGAPRKVDRDPEFPDEFNLIYRGEGGRRSRQILIQPGPQLLALLVQLVSSQSRRKFGTSAKLSDLLDVFDALGIDFRSNPEDFEGLKLQLLTLGLLQSSADAAEAASLNPRYSF